MCLVTKYCCKFHSLCSNFCCWIFFVCKSKSGFLLQIDSSTHQIYLFAPHLFCGEFCNLFQNKIPNISDKILGNNDWDISQAVPSLHKECANDKLSVIPSHSTINTNHFKIVNEARPPSFCRFLSIPYFLRTFTIAWKHQISAVECNKQTKIPNKET